MVLLYTSDRKAIEEQRVKRKRKERNKKMDQHKGKRKR